MEPKPWTQRKHCTPSCQQPARPRHPVTRRPRDGAGSGVGGGVETSSTSNNGIPSAHPHAKRHAKHRSIMKTLKKSTNVVVHQCCDRIHRMACTVCPHDEVYIPNKARILKKNSNHLLLIEDVKHAIRWCQGMDSIDLIGPYMWCRDYQK